MNTISINNKSLTLVASFVIAAHAILIGWMIIASFSPPKIVKRQERLVVKTVQLNPVTKREPAYIPETPSPTRSTPTAPKAEPVKKAPEEPAPLPKAKEPEKKIEPAKKAEPPKTSAAKPAATPAKKIEKPATESKPKVVKKTEPVKKEPAKQTTKPIEKKTTPPPVEKAKVDPQIEAAKTKAQQEAQEKQRKLIAAAQENIAKINQGRARIDAAKTNANPIALPVTAITGLQIEALPEGPQVPALTPGERSYRDELAGRLKLLLKLPEHGDIQLKLTLDRSGKVMKVDVIKSASGNNRSYIEKTLPNLKFPSFGNHFGSMSEYTFTIQLSNEL